MALSGPLTEGASATVTRIAIALIAVLAAPPVMAESVTYAGEDAARLKCAAMLSLAGNFARSEGRLDAAGHRKSLAAIGRLLAPLPGNGRDKARAMQEMADRIMLRSKPDALRREFKTVLPACGRYF